MDGSHTGPIGQRSNNAPLSLLAMLLSLVILVMGVVSFESYSSRSGIQRHGKRQEVDVTDIREVSYHGYRHDSCSIYGDLVFTPRGWDHFIKLKTYLSGCNQNSRAASYATQNHTLPIVYDTINPRNALIDLDNEVFRENIGATLKARILLIFCFASVSVLLVTLLSMFRKG